MLNDLLKIKHYENVMPDKKRARLEVVLGSFLIFSSPGHNMAACTIRVCFNVAVKIHLNLPCFIINLCNVRYSFKREPFKVEKMGLGVLIFIYIYQL